MMGENLYVNDAGTSNGDAAIIYKKLSASDLTDFFH